MNLDGIGYYGICPLCKKMKRFQKHHLFSNTKRNRKLYGKLIDDIRNILFICEACHLWKPIPKFTEFEFCKVLGIEPRSKTERFKNAL